MKILMVCLGNICRSPMAEGILRSKLPNNFVVDSAGTAGYHIGDKPDRRAIEVCEKHNIDISSLKGRKFSHKDFEDFDLIYVMDKSNYRNVISLSRKEEDKKKVRLILLEDINSQLEEVKDPYYGDFKDFEEVFLQLNNVCDIIAKKLLQN